MDCESEPMRTDKHKHGASLEAMAQVLKNRGLGVREHYHGNELIEITIVNPQGLDKGRVSVGYDGNVTWEYRGDIETSIGIKKIKDTVVNVLATGAVESSPASPPA